MQPTFPQTMVPDPDRNKSLSSPAVIQQALEEIVRSTPFRTTKQCQDLLRYVVDHTLAGQDQSLRERVIGAEVFARRPDYDTSEDPVVRIRAADVRRRLAQYYQGMHGSGPVVRIDIPSGSYRATFEWAAATETPKPAVVPVTAAPSVQMDAPQRESKSLPLTIVPLPMGTKVEQEMRGSVSREWVWKASLAALVVLLGISGLIWRSQTTAQTDFNRFWAPMLSGSKPVLICMGSNVVYRYSEEFIQQYQKQQHIEGESMESFVDLPPETMIHAGDVHRARDSFVALGDVAAVSDLVAILTRQGRSFQQRFPPDISFAELQATPTILIGGFNNQLTIALTKDLRYRMTRSSQVEDSQDASKRWTVQFHGDAHDAEDYAIVSRLLHSKSGGPVITVAGIGQFGTQAAAEFVSSPQQIAEFAKSAPMGWADKNLQVVLHVKVIDFRPVSTEVLASYSW